jgi:hypothetical protein
MATLGLACPKSEQWRRAVNRTVSEIFNAAGLSWRDSRRVFDAIFKVVIALTITIITSALYMTLALMPRGKSSFLLVMLVILTTIVQAFLITPGGGAPPHLSLCSSPVIQWTVIAHRPPHRLA